MGKKNRRRDQNKRGPSAGEKSQLEAASGIEESDPSYAYFQQLPKELSRLVVKHRFGGTFACDRGVICLFILVVAREQPDVYVRISR